MEDKRKTAFLPYLRDLANQMALKDWRPAVDNDAPPSDAGATVLPVQGRKFAVISLSEHFLNETPREQRHTCVHELLHCHFAQVDLMLSLFLDEEQRAIVDLHLEYVVDGLADAIAPLLPLPPSVVPPTPPPDLEDKSWQPSLE
jgi:hypothetical protein